MSCGRMVVTSQKGQWMNESSISIAVPVVRCEMIVEPLPSFSVTTSHRVSICRYDTSNSKHMHFIFSRTPIRGGYIIRIGNASARQQWRLPAAHCIYCTSTVCTEAVSACGRQTLGSCRATQAAALPANTPSSCLSCSPVVRVPRALVEFSRFRSTERLFSRGVCGGDKATRIIASGDGRKKRPCDERHGQKAKSACQQLGEKKFLYSYRPNSRLWFP